MMCFSTFDSFCSLYALVSKKSTWPVCSLRRKPNEEREARSKNFRGMFRFFRHKGRRGCTSAPSKFAVWTCKKPQHCIQVTNCLKFFLTASSLVVVYHSQERKCENTCVRSNLRIPQPKVSLGHLWQWNHRHQSLSNYATEVLVG